MKPFILVLVLVIFGFLPSQGCTFHSKVIPPHDEVLIYHLPYDLTYLRTLEALETLSDWELEETEKEKGVIVVHNVNYSHLLDADKRQATFFIKRVNREQTSIELAPESQRVQGGDVLLTRISKYITREL